MYTKGYQGESMESFFADLKSNNIQLLVDVRQNPFSFKKGFSKNQVELLSTQHGISYVHLKELGTPIPLRTMLKETGDYKEFFRSYEEIVEEYLDSIEDLVALAQTTNICLLCFEKDHRMCHRDIIAKKVEELSGKMLTVCHL
jgi:uncharacterized protein (DUF488 family)